MRTDTPVTLIFSGGRCVTIPREQYLVQRAIEGDDAALKQWRRDYTNIKEQSDD